MLAVKYTHFVQNFMIIELIYKYLIIKLIEFNFSNAIDKNRLKF